MAPHDEPANGAFRIGEGYDAPTISHTFSERGVPLTVAAPAAVVGEHAGAGSGEQPSTGPDAGIIVVQEAFGVNDHIASITVNLAAQGYVAVAPHLYHRVADTPAAEFAAARPLMATLNGDDLRFDLEQARQSLLAAGIAADAIGIVGFCMGGTVALWAASALPVAAAVTFYGSGVRKPRWPGVVSGLEAAAQLRAPWLGLYGDRDRSIPVADVEELRAVAERAPVPTAIVRYAHAGHAFATDPASPKHVPEAARDAWARTLGWFDAHLR